MSAQMLAPALQIVLAVEAAPTLRLDCVTEGDQERLLDWIYASDDLRELVERALKLANEEST